jgi:hypothetical protein
MDLMPFVLNRTRVFGFTLPSGESIPFKLLNWKEFCGYRDAALKGTIPQDIIDASVFNDCVLDPIVLDGIMDYHAGIVPTIAGLIMTLSGPSMVPAEFNQQLDQARANVDTIDAQVVMTICRAFPAYTPEDVQNLTWPNVVARLAQAERILLSKVPPELTGPFKLLTPEEAEQEQKKNSKKINPADLVKDGRKMAETVGVSQEDREDRQALMRREREKKIREMDRKRSR